MKLKVPDPSPSVLVAVRDTDLFPPVSATHGFTAPVKVMVIISLTAEGAAEVSVRILSAMSADHTAAASETTTLSLVSAPIATNSCKPDTSMVIVAPASIGSSMTMIDGDVSPSGAEIFSPLVAERPAADTGTARNA
ncbi:MAG: hypothetical protein LUO89_16325, partial [Methanothrix sp.]|nr:hypothetical protein [Methanothrix sp.]